MENPIKLQFRHHRKIILETNRESVNFHIFHGMTVLRDITCNDIINNISTIKVPSYFVQAKRFHTLNPDNIRRKSTKPNGV